MARKEWCARTAEPRAMVRTAQGAGRSNRAVLRGAGWGRALPMPELTWGRSAARRSPVEGGDPLLPALAVALAAALSLFQVHLVQQLLVFLVLDRRGPSCRVSRAFHRWFHPLWAY